MIRKILVALDGSPRAPHVLAAAAEIATRFDALVVPLRAIMVPPDFPPAAHVDEGDPLPTKMEQEAELYLATAVACLPGVRFAAPIVRQGQSWRTILAVADEQDVDLVVIGSHGYHGLDRVLGTTAGKVANLARRDVLVVHERVGPG